MKWHGAQLRARGGRFFLSRARGLARATLTEAHLCGATERVYLWHGLPVELQIAAVETKAQITVVQLHRAQFTVTE